MLIALLIAVGAAAQEPAGAPAKPHLPGTPRGARPGEGVESSQPLSIFATPEVLAALGPPRAQVGAWVEYAVRTRGKEDARVKLSILPPAIPDGRYWMEIDLATGSGAPAAVRLLVHGSPSRPQDIERATVYVPGQAVLEVPLDEVPEPPAAAARPATAAIRRRKPQRVRTAAGEFDRAEVLDVAGTRIWRADRVPLWGLVRSKSRGQAVELIGYASQGAHTLFQGKGSEIVK